MPPRIHPGYFILLLCAAALLVLPSCQQVVTVELNDAAPKMVIEGTLFDDTTHTAVMLSKSGDYFTPSLTVEYVHGATVLLSDDAGETDTLRESGPGRYDGARLAGRPGHTYSLAVFSEGRKYGAVSTMPVPVAIDSLYLEKTDPRGEARLSVRAMFKDPPGGRNYYRLQLFINGSLPVNALGIPQVRYNLYTDKLTDGSEANYRLRIGTVNPGDTVTVKLFSIDRATYDYYNTLRTILSSDRSPLSQAPANPNTNLTEGALGFFSAQSVTARSIVLQSDGSWRNI
jgi:hypothetical protein